MHVKLDTYELDTQMLQQVKNDRQARAQIYVYPYRAVILGRGSKIDREVFAQHIHADNIPLLRRAGGGCAVYLDPGNIICSIALPMEGFGKNPEAFAAISQALIKALDDLDIHDVQQRGISDLSQNDYKIGGSCIHRAKGLLYYSTTLLVSADLAAMQRYLQHPPREPDYRKGRDHAHFVRALQQHGQEDADSVDSRAPSLAQALAKRLNAVNIMNFSLRSTFVNLTEQS